MNLKQKLKEIFGVNIEPNSTPYPKDLVKALKDSFEKAYEFYQSEKINSAEYFDNITSVSIAIGLNSVDYHNLFIGLNNCLMKGYLSMSDFMQIFEHFPFLGNFLKLYFGLDWRKKIEIGEIQSIEAIKALNNYCVELLKDK